MPFKSDGVPRAGGAIGALSTAMAMMVTDDHHSIASIIITTPSHTSPSSKVCQIQGTFCEAHWVCTFEQNRSCPIIAHFASFFPFFHFFSSSSSHFLPLSPLLHASTLSSHPHLLLLAGSSQGRAIGLPRPFSPPLYNEQNTLFAHRFLRGTRNAR